jgi:DNA polymerase IV
MNWIVECFRSKYLQGTYWDRFQVNGSEKRPLANVVAPPSRESSPALSLHKTDAASQPENLAYSAEDGLVEISKSAGEDELERVISGVISGAILPPSHDSSEVSSSEDEDPSTSTSNPTSKNAGYLCMEKHTGKNDNPNPNENTIKQLQAMASVYDSTGDEWRTQTFRKAIGKLRRQNTLIRTSQEAREIGLGNSLANQVEEMVRTGQYKRLKYAQNDPRTQLVKIFTGVYGAGETTAYKWIAQGHRSLDDVRQRAELTASQKIGLEHYDDFQQRIPRAEVAQHAAMVEAALKDADSEAQLIIGGSYRRGKQDSGDIDCIIFREGADIVHIRTLMVDTVIPNLMTQDFLKVGLATGHRSSDDSSKWHGASALPGNKVWRRIDFLFVPWAELGAALIYFTGNDIFNRSIRLLASKKGMRLNQHGLYKDVMRGPRRQRITEGTLLEAHSEKRIFEILGVPYRSPEERNAGGTQVA